MRETARSHWMSVETAMQQREREREPMTLLDAILLGHHRERKSEVKCVFETESIDQALSKGNLQYIHGETSRKIT